MALLGSGRAGGTERPEKGAVGSGRRIRMEEGLNGQQKVTQEEKR